jgi:hypothetical protein
VYANEVFGGLGVQNLIQFNHALMGKWLWRYATEWERLRKLVKIKHDSHMGDWCSKEVGECMEWECGNVFEGGGRALCNTCGMIGDGTKVLFWHDVWCGECPLKLVYPPLFNSAFNKDAWVKEYMERPNDTLHWNVQFIRPVHDWELEGVSCFFALLYSQKIRFGGEDKICWVPSKRDTFEVKSYYHSPFTSA